MSLGLDAVPGAALHALVRTLPLAVAVFDHSLRYLVVSHAWREAYPTVDEQDHRGHALEDHFPEISAELLSRLHHCLSEGVRGPCADQEPPRPSTTLADARWQVSRWLDIDHGPGLMIFATQFAARKRAQRQLREREGFIRQLFDSSHVGLNLCRLDGLWLESSPAFLDIIGYSREEADGGLTYWELTPRKYDAEEARQIESLTNTGRYGPYEKEFIRKDGSLVPVRLNGFLIERDNQQFIWSFIEDMSAELALQQELEQERLKAVRASKLATMGEMAAGVAHEINNPLAIIDAYAFELPDAIERGDAELVREGIQAIRNAVHRAGKIITGLRKYARDGVGGTAEQVSVRQLTRDALDLCEARLRNHGVELEVEVHTDQEVFCNRVEMSQVLLNLLNNAFDAVRTGSRREIRVVAQRGPEPDGWVEICVEDSGPGVPAEAIERLFQPFFTTKPTGEGTGLGLSISDGIVRAMGGSIHHEVVESRGLPRTRFVVLLPALELL